jgi:hypothetical protein
LFPTLGDAGKWSTEARDVGFIFIEQLKTFLRVVEDGFELLLDLINTGRSRFSLTRSVRRLRQLSLSTGQDRLRGVMLDRQTRDARCYFSETGLFTGWGARLAVLHR